MKTQSTPARLALCLLMLTGGLLARAQTISTNGLVLWLPFNETNGLTAYDQSGYTNNAIFSATPQWQQPGSYSTNASVWLDGGEYADIPASSSLDVSGTNLTIAGWILPYTSGQQYIVDMPYTNTDLSGGVISDPEFKYGLVMDPDNSLHFYFYDQTSGEQNKHSSPNLLPLGTWTHFAMVWDGVQVKFYANGVLEGSYGQPGVLGPRNSPLRIGADATAGRIFDGQLNDLLIYNRALRQIDVRSLFSSDPTPIVSITSPADGTEYPNPANFTVTAHAEAITGQTITNVQYYIDGVLAGHATTDPYSVALGITNSVEGTPVTHAITSVATDSAGQSTTSAPIYVTVEPPPALPHVPAMGAGDLIADLHSADLNAGSPIWTNRSKYPDAVGDFHTFGGGNLNVSTAYAWQTHTTPALGVVNSTTRAVVSAAAVPYGMGSNGTFSGEAWAFTPAAATSGNSDCIGYGIQGGSAAPKEDREMMLWPSTSPTAKGFSFNFGGRDVNWNAAPGIGAWHYVAWTVGGSNDNNNCKLYKDGVLDKTQGGSAQVLSTVITKLIVGASEGGGNTDGTALGNAFCGYIASVRVWSGQLSDAAVANNYTAGPFADVPVQLFAPAITPYFTNLYQGGTVTLSVSAITNNSWPMTYQWYTDSGSGGATWTPVTGATGLTYTPDTSVLGTYQYQVAATNATADGAGGLSAPVTLNVVTCSAPTGAVVSPASQSVVAGTPATFTVSATGPGPLHYQWRKNGTTSVGSNSSSYTIAAAASTDAGSYDCVVTNACGSITASAGTLSVTPFVLGSSFSNGALTLTWSAGTLLQATNVRGPWLTNPAPSPVVIYPSTNGPAMFYRLQH